MDVIVKNYQGKNRRKGGKLKLTTFDKLVILFVVVSLLTGGATWYDLTDRSLTALASEVEASTGADIRQDNIIGVIQNDISTMKADIRGLLTGRQVDQRLLYKIWGKVSE